MADVAAKAESGVWVAAVVVEQGVAFVVGEEIMAVGPLSSAAFE